MFVCPSVRMEQLTLHWTYVDETWYLRLFRKFVEKIQISLKSDKNNGYFMWRRFHVYDNIALRVVEKIKTHILCSILFLFRESCRLWDDVETCGGFRGATNDVTICHIRFVFWISKATCTRAHAHVHAPGHTHARQRAHTHEYVIFIPFSRQQWFANAPKCYVICTLLVLSFFGFNSIRPPASNIEIFYSLMKVNAVNS